MNTQQPIVSDYINQDIGSGKRTTTLSTISFIQSIGQVIVRILLGTSVGLIGLGHTNIVQVAYMLVGVSIGGWYIRRCGCVHRVNHIENSVAEVV